MSDAPPASSRGWPRIAVGFLCVLLALAAWFSRPPDVLARPFSQDEIVTLGTTTFGWPEEFDKVRGSERGDVRALARGLVRTVNTGWSPNQQLLNSVLVSVSAFLCGLTEPAARYPALAGLAISAGLLTWLGTRLSGSWALGAVLGGLLICHPFFQQYSVSSRGYTLATALMLGQALLLEHLPRAKGRAFLALGVVAALSFLSFVTLASSLWSWVVPLVFGGAARLRLWARETAAAGEEWRERWRETGIVWGLLSISALGACALFIALRLPDFLDAQKRWGLILQGNGVAVAAGVWRTLFPGALVVVGILVVLSVGILIVRRRKGGWLLFTLIGSTVLCVLYTAVTRKVPYERTFGPFFPIWALVLAAAWPELRMFQRGRWLRGAALGILLLTLGLCAWGLGREPERGSYTATAAKFTREARAGGGSLEKTMLVLPWIWDLRFYLPAEDAHYELAAQPPAEMQWAFFVQREGDALRLRTMYWDAIGETFLFWTLPASLQARESAVTGSYRAAVSTLKVDPIPVGDAGPADPAFFWLQTTALPTKALVERLRALAPPDALASWRVLPQRTRHGLGIGFFPTTEWPLADAGEAARAAQRALGGALFAVSPAGGP